MRLLLPALLRRPSVTHHRRRLLLLSLVAGCGSSAVDATPSQSVVAPPGAPTSVTATALDGAANVAFTPPVSGTGGTMTFTVTCAPGGNGAGSSVTAAGTTSPIRVGGLTNGINYACTVTAANSGGTGPASAAVSVRPAAVTLGAFRGNVVLGSPTRSSIKLNVYAADQSGSVSVKYGTTPGAYDRQTSAVALNQDAPVEITLDGLAANTRYYYRLQYDGGAGAGPTAEASFQTARAPGSTFVFALQGDSHPERVRQQFDSALYMKTLGLVAADNPDFYIMLGDDFSIDQLEPTTITQAQVRGRYTLQRPYLGIVGRSAPIFLVNGNHEQAARYLLDGTPNNPAVWAQNSRNSLYSEPAPDGFYTGNTEQVPFIGLLRNYFAFQWGDALFVMIDPYWESSVAVDNSFYGNTKRPDLWSITHGDAQYAWLKSTLETSTAKYKFVFAHHVLGTQRGGVEVAKQYEWGGLGARGTNEFATQRPTWSAPIHQLFVQNHVSVFFQGHDHIWVHQQLDGVTYQEVSEPADPNYSIFNSDAYTVGEQFPNTGYTRVTVTPASVKVEYVRVWLPADETPAQKSGAIAFTYSIP